MPSPRKSRELDESESPFLSLVKEMLKKEPPPALRKKKGKKAAKKSTTEKR